MHTSGKASLETLRKQAGQYAILLPTPAHFAPTKELLRPRMLPDAFWLQDRKAFLENAWPSRSVLRFRPERYRDYCLEPKLPNQLAEAG